MGAACWCCVCKGARASIIIKLVLAALRIETGISQLVKVVQLIQLLLRFDRVLILRDIEVVEEWVIFFILTPGRVLLHRLVLYGFSLWGLIYFLILELREQILLGSCLLRLQLIRMKVVIARINEAVGVWGWRLRHLCNFYPIRATLWWAHDARTTAHQAFLCSIYADFRDLRLGNLTLKVDYCWGFWRWRLGKAHVDVLLLQDELAILIYALLKIWLDLFWWVYIALSCLFSHGRYLSAMSLRTFELPCFILHQCNIIVHDSSCRFWALQGIVCRESIVHSRSSLRWWHRWWRLAMSCCRCLLLWCIWNMLWLIFRWAFSLLCARSLSRISMGRRCMLFQTTMRRHWLRCRSGLIVLMLFVNLLLL